MNEYLLVFLLLAFGVGFACGAAWGFFRGSSINIVVRGDQVSVRTSPE